MALPIFYSLLLTVCPWLLGRLLILHGDIAAAAHNLRRILRSKPQIVQFLLSLWPMGWGINAILHGDALWATAPEVYAWMHIFPCLHAGVWGGVMFFLGLWQIRALIWPTPYRLRSMRLAGRAMCSMNAGLALGFFLAAPSSPSFILYGIFAMASVWCLWRLSGRNKDATAGEADFSEADFGDASLDETSVGGK